MIIILFKSRARAGDPVYLVDHRKDRCIYVRGYRVSLSYLLAVARTDNPTTAGAICFEGEVDLDVALYWAEIVVYLHLLSGADIAAVPHMFVVHREPCFGGGYRTVVHFVLLNYHLGVQEVIRPYLHDKDRFWLERVQEDINLRGQFRDPNDCRRTVVFSQRHFDEKELLECSLFEIAKKWVLANGSSPNGPSEVELRLNEYLEDVKAQFPDLSPRIVTETKSTAIYFGLQYGDGKFLKLCKCPKRPERRIQAQPVEPGYVNVKEMDFDDIAQWRRQKMVSKYGVKWTDPIFAPNLNRESIYDIKRPFGGYEATTPAELDELERKCQSLPPKKITPPDTPKS